MPLQVYFDHEGDFYSRMGPFFATRAHVREMGGWQFYTLPGAMWLVISSDSNQIQGFCSLVPKKGYLLLDNLFILPEYRGLKLSNRLLDSVLAEGFQQEIRCITNNPHQLAKFIRLGFESVGVRGGFTRLARKPRSVSI